VSRSLKAGPGWVALAGFVVGYDYWAIHGGHETLSGACWRHCQKHHVRAVLTVSAALLYKHLMAPKMLPQIDPLNHLATRWHSKRAWNLDVAASQSQSGFSHQG